MYNKRPTPNNSSKVSPKNMATYIMSEDVRNKYVQKIQELVVLDYYKYVLNVSGAEKIIILAWSNSRHVALLVKDMNANTWSERFCKTCVEKGGCANCHQGRHKEYYAVTGVPESVLARFTTELEKSIEACKADEDLNREIRRTAKTKRDRLESTQYDSKAEYLEEAFRLMGL
jgi:hypothetical protein